ncbi:hypothetical protein [Parachryseolinea silvisoli]|uniref:hypothetical protein n=1 Tax=Parachryseolinea silvisoli TaxID=2873601 RepID=UPI0022658B82|nr:hypothetical protein [Parachryseolinea silvisoli]MCD9014246.1 hypothetical protein [Parachryseolinea silvisoli]
MFGFFKKKRNETKESEAHQKPETEYSFKWYEVGAENPFNKRILDIRSFTLSMIATTSKKEIADTYSALRGSLGEEYKGMSVPNSKTVSVNLKYPHNGAALEGIVFKADSMDVKWDIYIYDDIFYFTRSWTGDLGYKVTARIHADSIELLHVECSADEDDLIAINNVHFLIVAHALSKVYPHMIPKELVTEKEIALYSFSTFGNKACYATYEPITDTVITVKK